MKTDAYRCLSGNGAKLLLHLAAMENGKNNGELFLSVRDAARAMNVGDIKTGARVLRELKDFGFIVPTRMGSFRVKGGDATCWRLTWLPVRDRSCATHDYRQWQPEPGSDDERKLRWGFSPSVVGEMPTIAAKPVAAKPATVGEMPTAPAQDWPVAVGEGVGIMPTHTVASEGAVSGVARAEPFQCNSARTMARKAISAGGVGAQRRLAQKSGLSEPKLSRFLARPRGTLTPDDYRRLMAAIGEANDARRFATLRSPNRVAQSRAAQA